MDTPGAISIVGVIGATSPAQKAMMSSCVQPTFRSACWLRPAHTLQASAEGAQHEV